MPYAALPDQHCISATILRQLQQHSMKFLLLLLQGFDHRRRSSGGRKRIVA
jgi:hypothetical protein